MFGIYEQKWLGRCPLCVNLQGLTPSSNVSFDQAIQFVALVE
jgi:hypothetical protein